ncbi:MAG: ATP-binding protein, partial [Acidimicrobiales bacterium]
ALAALDGRPARPDEILAGLRARTRPRLPRGVRAVTPGPGTERWVAGPAVARAVTQAVDRIRHRMTVHHAWGLTVGRPGGTGVRMLLAGPPGTGKTLTAEVTAARLGVDLLVVDLAQIVSKWLGETEKNLAGVFTAAERSQSVLLFDEADALFARRTDVNDAHDRYANLETAYLLHRLEQFDGLTVLTTNLRSQIDPAFIRRLDIVVDLPEPDPAQRRELWSRHLPAGAPRAADVDLAELADRYPLPGGLIRNAATTAAFAAAAARAPIDRRGLIDAIEQESVKAGRAFPGRPADLARSTRSGADSPPP